MNDFVLIDCVSIAVGKIYTYEEILSISGIESLQIKIDSRVLQLAGHIARMSPDRMPNKILFDVERLGNPSQYEKPLRHALERIDMKEITWKQEAQSKKIWNQKIEIHKETSKLKRRRIRKPKV